VPAASKPRIDRSISTALWVAASIAIAGNAGAVGTQTITTTYAYNADGAPTAVTTQVDAQPATTTYLTWDNFTPDASTPTAGTIGAGDGNLTGIGPSPGPSGLTTQFTYDTRDRLAGCSATGQSSAAYAYHPSGPLASSTLASGDALQFYYDSGATPLMVNTLQSSTGLAASFLGPVRYLSDGTEQVLLQPRKDTAGVYDAAAQTLSPYQYDPYGTASSGSASASTGLTSGGTSYDLTANPFRYTGEYQDPTCSTYYLRARWYLPAQQTFLSRDPGDPLHRYGYTAGDPVGHVDPSGLHGVEAGARKFLEDIDANHNGPGGIASRFFLGSAIGIAQIFANPSGYWQELKHDTNGIDTFLAAGILAEVATSGWGPLPELSASYRASFLGRHLVDTFIGAGQSFATGADKHHFDWASVGQGLELTAGGMFEGRELLGFGYKPYNLSADDVTQRAARHFVGGSGNDDDILVYRVRGPLINAWGVRRVQFTSPLLELGHIGIYHESLVGILLQYDVDTSSTIPHNYRIQTDPLRLVQEDRFIHTRRIDNGVGVGFGERERASYVGRYSGGADNFYGIVNRPNGDRDFQTVAALRKYKQANGVYPKNPYWLIGNNCQSFAAQVRKNLGFR
jgi:RHS repeat-associated protein